MNNFFTPDQFMELIKARCAILENLQIAREIVGQSTEASRAEAYWIPHIWGNVTREHEWLGAGSMFCMDETINALIDEELIDGLREYLNDLDPQEFSAEVREYIQNLICTFDDQAEEAEEE